MRFEGEFSREALGYDFHTNRELGFMLRGVKPLAVFCCALLHGFPEVVLRYMRLFDLSVSRGWLEKCEYVELLPEKAHEGWGRGMHVVMYARLGDDWRFTEMIKLRQTMYDGEPWSDEKERREGELLGYEDWQNDIWIGRKLGPHRA